MKKKNNFDLKEKDLKLKQGQLQHTQNTAHSSLDHYTFRQGRHTNLKWRSTFKTYYKKLY